MAIRKKPYLGRYPSAARALIEAGVCTAPRQREREFKKTSGLDIIYTLKGMTPARFGYYSDTLLLLAYQEAMRYDEYRWKSAYFDVHLGRTKKGRELPDVVTFQAAMNPDPEVMVYGAGQPTPRREFLYNKVEDILEIAKRYADKVRKQKPFRVLRLVICIRDEV